MHDEGAGSDKEVHTSAGDFKMVSPKIIDPDAYKEDWEDSNIYKKAMKSEAIKRGRSFD